MLNENKKKQKTANLQLVKMSNLSLVFNLINKRESISRAELAHVTGLSPATVSSLVDELIYDSMVLECGTGNLAGSGRKPILLKVNPEGGFVLTVEVSSSGFILALFNLAGSLIYEHEKELINFDTLGFELVKSVESTLSEYKISEEKLLGICIGVPGVINKVTKRVSSTVLPITEDNAFFGVLQNRYRDIPVKMGNSSCFCAYSEKTVLNTKVQSLVYIDFNVGIGAGIILDGRVYTGAFGNAGEFGHISVDYNGPVCKCGNHGCLEAIASIPAIVKRVAEGVGNVEMTSIKGCVTLEDVCIALNNRDEFVESVISESSRALATGINSVVNMVNPEAIIIGGDITKLGSRFLEMLRRELGSIMFKTNSEKLIIDYSDVSVNPVTHGAACYMLDTIFKTNGFLIN